MFVFALRGRLIERLIRTFPSARMLTAKVAKTTYEQVDLEHRVLDT